jgi:hypothetical protein
MQNQSQQKIGLNILREWNWEPVQLPHTQGQGVVKGERFNIVQREASNIDCLSHW